MGNASSQPEPFPEIPEDFGDIVPETSLSSDMNRKKKRNKKSFPSKSEALSPIANGKTRSPQPDSNISTPSKRKRGSEHEPKQKKKKHRKSGNQASGDPASQEENSTSTNPAQLAPIPGQPTPSNPELSQAKQLQELRKHDKEAIAPSQSTQVTRDMKVAEETPAVKQPTVAKQIPATGSPNPEGSALSGGRVKGIRGSRTREKDNLKIGFYTPDEVRTIETYKVNFCTMHGISSTLFDEMVQHSERGASGDFPVSSEIITKSDFWNEIYALVPDRDRRSVYRFMRRHFQASAQRAHDWSEEQDEELIKLHAKYGPKWSYIGKLIGRSDDDVTQRWKNKLEHKGTMNQGAWSEEETRIFLDAVESSWMTMKPMLNETAGKDFYQLDERLIIWGNISKAMGHTRSRQQCADKWRKIVRQVMTMRANGQPDAVYDPKLAAKKAANWNIRLEGQRKSSQFVNEDFDEDQSMMVTKVATPEPRPQGETDPASVPEANVESDHKVHSEKDEANSPEPSKKTKKPKSKSKRTEEPAPAPINEAPPSPSTPKKDKEEKNREKERWEKVMEEQIEQEAKEKEEKAARKERKRKKKKEEKRKRQEAEQRLAAETSSHDAEAHEPPKKRKKPKEE